MGTPDHLTCLLRNLYVLKQTNKQTNKTVITGHGMTVSKLDKEYDKAVYCHYAHLIYMQSTSCEISGLMNQTWNQDYQEKYQQPQICRLYYCNGRKWRGTKEPLDEGERGRWKSWLKFQYSKNKDHGIQSHHFFANRRGKSGMGDRFSTLGLQNHWGWWL